MDTVFGAWLEPGTASKRKTPRSPKRRLYQGAKGIGRFAAARLAESLILETKSDDAGEEVLVVLDWGEFDEDSYLEDIEVEYEVFTSSKKSGTTLTLDRVRSEWLEEDYEQLYDRLSRLISPFDEVIDFKIDLHVPRYPNYTGDVQPPDIISRPKYMLTGKLDDMGFFNGKFIREGVVTIIWGDDVKDQNDSWRISDDVQIKDHLKRGNSPYAQDV
jgi:hypothetical protein